MFHLWPPVIRLVLIILHLVYTDAMDRILRGGLQRPGRAVRLHSPGQLRQESQEEPRARSGIEGRDYGPEGRQGYNSTSSHTFTTRSSKMHYSFPNLFTNTSTSVLPKRHTYPTTIYSTIDRMRTSQSIQPVSASSLRETTAAATTITSFNPRMQYGRTVRRRTQFRGFQDHSMGRKFTKSIIVSMPGSDLVPRGASKQALHTKGLVVHFVDFWTGYEEDIRWTIEAALGGVIDVTKPEPRFDFLQANCGKLIKRNVPPNHKWTGDKIQKLAGQGDIYIRPTYVVEDILDEDCEAILELDDVRDNPLPSDQPCSSSTAYRSCSHHNKHLKMLEEMFPAVAPEVLRVLLNQSSNNVNIVVGELLDVASVHAFPFQGSSSDSHAMATKSIKTTPLGNSECKSPKHLLKNLSNEMILSGYYEELQIDRSRLWRTALGFYKTMIHTPERLKFELRIEFNNEEGIDAGALRREFFELLLKELNTYMFQGAENRRIPKKDSSLQQMFEVAGIMMAHSILQGGPGFPCLCPSIYNYLLNADKNSTLQDMKSTDIYIPVNAATYNLLEFIHKLDDAKSNGDIDKLLDAPENMALINSSNWPVTEAITCANKAVLIQDLVYAEIIDKRQTQLQHLRNGLNQFDIINLCKTNPDEFKFLFIHEEAPFTYETMLNLISFDQKASEDKEVECVSWLKDYLRTRANEKSDDEEKTKATLNDFLQFATGLRSIPPLGFTQRITIRFISKELPEASTCFHTLYLPTKLDSKENFFTSFDQAILYSKNYFGLH